MPRNVEIKARAADFAGQRRRAAELCGGEPEILHQEDTFFRVSDGRLKLRILDPGRGELIHYHREDSRGPRPSRYTIVPTAEPERLRRLLAEALGVRGVVRKTRTLFLLGPTRIHFDQVEGLGEFLELEVVLGDGQPPADGERVARELAGKLGIRESDQIAVAYLDLLERAGPGGNAP